MLPGEKFLARSIGLIGLVLAVACGSPEESPRRTAEPVLATAGEERPGGRVAARSRWERRYYSGRLSLALGEIEESRLAFAAVVATAGKEAPDVAARAALALAEVEARSGGRRQAMELVARAEALGGDDVGIAHQVRLWQLRLASTAPQDIEIRGPAPFTELAGVTASTQEQFRRAEELLVAYHRRRIRPRFEALRASVRTKRFAVDKAVHAYRAVIETGEKPAVVAGLYRIASLYNDHAMSLRFDLPAELDQDEAARMRRELREQAVADLRRALRHYERSRDAAVGVAEETAGAWRAAVELELPAVEDMLRPRD